TSAGGASTFTADITGAATGRLTGTASAGAGSDWSRESVVQVTLPNAGQVSGIVLATAGNANAISFLRSGADVALGTFQLGRAQSGGYSAGYVVRRSDGLQLFSADSGTLSMTESAGRVTGTFTLYVDKYDVLPIPSLDLVGKPITPISSGRASMTITGSFNAVRR
ncbi:MAG TPA: hypothetical protein VM076_07525, partial [Gemmatimonadaceae bacterium]|nr:hypothetical protein [Gemmatimonadaceae bacterium]